MFLLIKIGFTKVTQNWFRKRYSTFVPQVFSKLVSPTLLKTGSMSVTQNYFHKRYSKFVSQALLE